MIAANANNVAGPRQVTCETAMNELVAVDFEDLRVSKTFSKMCEDLDLKEHDEYPGVFPVRGISSDVFNRVMAWCKEHKGLPEPIIEKHAFSQEVEWLKLTPYEKRFLDVSVPVLFELITAANLLHIPSLYHGACQAVAALIAGKSPADVRLIRQQRVNVSDLSIDDMQQIVDGSPWLDQKCVYTEKPINIPAEVLVTILEKLPRVDIERLQLVSAQFRDVIQDSQTPGRELSEERGPLRVVDLKLGATLDGDHRVRSRRNYNSRTCRGVDELAKLLEFCKVYYLRLSDKIDDALLEALVPLRRAWKNANLEEASLCSFSSDEQFRFAFTEVFLCKEIQLYDFGYASFSPQPFLRLPAMWQCNDLDIVGTNGLGDGRNVLQASDILEWLEGGAPKQLGIWEQAITGGFERLVDALKTAFLEADRPCAYKVHIRKDGFLSGDDEGFVAPPRTSQQIRNEKTKEQLEIRTVSDDDLVLERKQTRIKCVS